MFCKLMDTGLQGDFSALASPMYFMVYLSKFYCYMMTILPNYDKVIVTIRQYAIGLYEMNEIAAGGGGME